MNVKYVSQTKKNNSYLLNLYTSKKYVVFNVALLSYDLFTPETFKFLIFSYAYLKNSIQLWSGYGPNTILIKTSAHNNSHCNRRITESIVTLIYYPSELFNFKIIYQWIRFRLIEQFIMIFYQRQTVTELLYVQEVVTRFI